MNVESLVLLSLLACAFSGVPGVVLGRRSTIGESFAAMGMVLGSVSGLAGVALFFSTDQTFWVEIPAPLQSMQFSFTMDAISAIFLVPIYLISGLGAIYGVSYWRQREHP